MSVRQVVGGLLISAAVAAALAMGSHALLGRYVATWVMPLERNLTDRRWLDVMEAQDFLQRFETVYGLSANPAFAPLKAQVLDRNLESPIRIEAVPRFSRRDARQLNDVSAKEIATQSMRSFDLTTTARARGADTAVARADMAMKYAREALLASALADLVERITLQADARLAETRRQISEVVYEMERLERRLSQIGDIRDRYRSGPDDDVPQSGVSVQVNNTLSPRQHMIQLELRRVELKEKDVTAREAIAATNAIKALVDKTRAAAPTGLLVRADAEQLLAAVRAMLATSTATAVQVSLRELEAQIEQFLARYVHQPANTSSPLVTPPSILLPALIAVLGTLGLAFLWGIWSYRRRLWKLVAQRVALPADPA